MPDPPEQNVGMAAADAAVAATDSHITGAVAAADEQREADYDDSLATSSVADSERARFEFGHFDPERDKGKLSLSSVMKLKGWLSNMRTRMRTPPWQHWLDNLVDLEWFLVHALRKRTLNLQPDKFLTQCVQQGYFSVAEFKTFREFLDLDLWTFQSGDKLKALIGRDRVDSMPRPLLPLEARRQMVILTYSVNRLGKLLVAKMRHLLLEDEDRADQQHEDHNIKGQQTSSSLALGANLAQVIQAMMHASNSRAIQFTEFVEVCERMFLPTEEKGLGLLKIANYASGSRSSATNGSSNRGGDTTSPEASPRLGAVDGASSSGISNANNVVLITKRYLFMNLFKMLSGRPVELSKMPAEKVHVDEMASALCDVNANQLLALRNAMLRKYGTFSNAFAVLKQQGTAGASDDQQAEMMSATLRTSSEKASTMTSSAASGGGATARSGGSGTQQEPSTAMKQQPSSLLNRYIADADIKIQDYIPKERFVAMYLHLVHHRADPLAAFSASAESGGGSSAASASSSKLNEMLAEMNEINDAKMLNNDVKIDREGEQENASNISSAVSAALTSGLTLQNCWSFHEDPFDDPAFRHLADKRRRVQAEEAEALYQYTRCLGMFSHFASRTETRKIEGVDYDTFLHLMALPAPQVGISAFRKRVLLRYGSWVQALRNLLLAQTHLVQGSVKPNAKPVRRVLFTWRDLLVLENNESKTGDRSGEVVVGAAGRTMMSNATAVDEDVWDNLEEDKQELQSFHFFEVFGGAIDLSRADSSGLFRYLTDRPAERKMTCGRFRDRLENADGFDLEEFALRLWAAKRPGAGFEETLMERLLSWNAKHAVAGAAAGMDKDQAVAGDQGAVGEQSGEHDAASHSPKSSATSPDALDPFRPLLKVEFAAEIFGIYLNRQTRLAYEKKRLQALGSSTAGNTSSSGFNLDDDGPDAGGAASPPPSPKKRDAAPTPKTSPNRKAAVMKNMRKMKNAGMGAGVMASGSEISKSPEGALLPTYPALTPAEVSKLYDILRDEKKAGELPTFHSLLRYLPANVSNVLCVSATKYQIGETALVSFNLPREYSTSSGLGTACRDIFLAVVCGHVGGSSVADDHFGTQEGSSSSLEQLSVDESQIRARFPIAKGVTDGMLPVQILPPTGEFDGTMFSFALLTTPATPSTTTSSYSVIGAPVLYSIMGPKPGRPQISNVTPTSCELSWRPVNPLELNECANSYGPVVEYVVRAEPLTQMFEENCQMSGEKFQIQSRWNGKTQMAEPVCKFSMQNLIPGLPYRFSVLPRHAMTGIAGGGSGMGSTGSSGAGDRTTRSGSGGPPAAALTKSLPAGTSSASAAAGVGAGKAAMLGQIYAGASSASLFASGDQHPDQLPPLMNSTSSSAMRQALIVRQPSSVEGSASLFSDVVVPPVRQRPPAPGRPELLKISTDEATVCIPMTNPNQSAETMRQVSFDRVQIEFCVAAEWKMPGLLDEQQRTKEFAQLKIEDPFAREGRTDPDSCTGWLSVPISSMMHRWSADKKEVYVTIKPVPEVWLMHMREKDFANTDRGKGIAMRGESPTAGATREVGENDGDDVVEGEEKDEKPPQQTSKIVVKAALATGELKKTTSSATSAAASSEVSDFSPISLPRNCVLNGSNTGRIKEFDATYEEQRSRVLFDLPDPHVDWDQIMLDYQYELQIWVDPGEDHIYLRTGPDGTAADARKRIAFERDRKKEFADPNRIRKHWTQLFDFVGTLPLAKALPKAVVEVSGSGGKAGGAAGMKKPPNVNTGGADFSNASDHDKQKDSRLRLQGSVVLADAILEAAPDRKLLENLLSQHHDCYISLKLRGRFFSGKPMSWSDNKLIKLSTVFSQTYAARCLLLSDAFGKMAAATAGGSNFEDSKKEPNYEDMTDQAALQLFLSCTNRDAVQRMEKVKNWEQIRSRMAMAKQASGNGKKGENKKGGRKKAAVKVVSELEMSADLALLQKAAGSALVKSTGLGGSADQHATEDHLSNLDAEQKKIVRTLAEMRAEIGDDQELLTLAEKAFGGRALFVAKYGRVLVAGKTNAGGAPAPSTLSLVAARRPATAGTSAEGEEITENPPSIDAEEGAENADSGEGQGPGVGEVVEGDEGGEINSETELLDDSVEALQKSSTANTNAENSSSAVKLHRELSSFLRHFGCLSDVFVPVEKKEEDPSTAAEGATAPKKKPAQQAAPPSQTNAHVVRHWRPVVDGAVSAEPIEPTALTDADLTDFGQKARAGLKPGQNRVGHCRLRLDLYSETGEKILAAPTSSSGVLDHHQDLQVCRLESHFDLDLNSQAPFLLKNLEEMQTILSRDPAEVEITNDVHGLLFEKYALNDAFDNFDESKLSAILDQLLQLVLDPPTKAEDCSEEQVDVKRNELLNDGVEGDHELLSTMLRVERFQHFVEVLGVQGLTWAYTFFTKIKDESSLPSVDHVLELLNHVNGFGGLEKFFEFFAVFADKRSYWDAVGFWETFLNAPGPFQVLPTGQIVPHPQAFMLRQDTKRHILQHKQIAVQVLLHLDQCGTKPLLGFYNANIRPKLRKKQKKAARRNETSEKAASPPPGILKGGSSGASVELQTSELHKIIDKGRRGNVYWCGLARALDILTINAEMKLDHYIEAGKVLEYCQREVLLGDAGGDVGGSGGSGGTSSGGDLMPLRDLLFLMEQGSLCKGGIKDLAACIKKAKPDRVIPMLEVLAEPRINHLDEDYVRESLTLVLDTGGPQACQATLRDAKLLMRQLKEGCSLFEFEKSARFFGGGTELVKAVRFLEKTCEYESFPIVKLVPLLGAIAPSQKDLPALWDFLHQIQDLQVHNDWLELGTDLAKIGEGGTFTPEALVKKPPGAEELADYRKKIKLVCAQIGNERGKAMNTKLRGELEQDPTPLSEGVAQAWAGVDEIEKNATEKSALADFLKILKSCGDMRLTDVVILLQFVRKNSDWTHLLNSLQYLKFVTKLSAQNLLPKDPYNEGATADPMVLREEQEQLSLEKILQHVHHYTHHGETVRTYGRFEKDLIDKVSSKHWHNVFNLGAEVVRVTRCPTNAENLADLKFKFYIENAELLEESFCGFTEAFRNSVKILDACKITGLKNVRMALDDPLQPLFYRGTFLPGKAVRNLQKGILLSKNEQCRRLESVSMIEDDSGGMVSNSQGNTMNNTMFEFVHAGKESIERGSADAAFAGATHDVINDVEDHWEVWLKVVRELTKTGRGPSFFVESVEHSDISEFLFCVDALKAAQLLGAEVPGELDDAGDGSPRVSSPRRADRHKPAGVVGDLPSVVRSPAEVGSANGAASKGGKGKKSSGSRKKTGNYYSSDHSGEGALTVKNENRYLSKLTDEETEEFVEKSKWETESIYPELSPRRTSVLADKEVKLVGGEIAGRVSGAGSSPPVSFDTGEDKNVEGEHKTAKATAMQTQEKQWELQNPQLVAKLNGELRNVEQMRRTSHEHSFGRVGWQRVSRFSPLKALLHQLELFGGSETFCWLLRGVPLQNVKAQTLALQTLEGSPLITEEKERGLLVRLLELVQELGGLRKAITALQDEVEAEHTFTRVQTQLSGAKPVSVAATSSTTPSGAGATSGGPGAGGSATTTGTAAAAPAAGSTPAVQGILKTQLAAPNAHAQTGAQTGTKKTTTLSVDGAHAPAPAAAATQANSTSQSLNPTAAPAGEAGAGVAAGEVGASPVPAVADESKSPSSKLLGGATAGVDFINRAKRKKTNVFFTALGERICDELALDISNEQESLLQAEQLVSLYRVLCGPGLAEQEAHRAEMAARRAAATEEDAMMEVGGGGGKGVGKGKGPGKAGGKKGGAAAGEGRVRKYQPVKWQNPNLHPEKKPNYTGNKRTSAKMQAAGGAAGDRDHVHGPADSRDQAARHLQENGRPHALAQTSAEALLPTVQVTKLSANEIAVYQQLLREVMQWYRAGNLAKDAVPDRQLVSANEKSAVLVDKNLTYAKLLIKYLQLLTRLQAYDADFFHQLSDLFDFGRRVSPQKALRMWASLKNVFPQSKVEEWDTLKNWMMRLGSYGGERVLSVAPMVRLVSRVVETREGQKVLHDVFTERLQQQRSLGMTAAGGATSGPTGAGAVPVEVLSEVDHGHNLLAGGAPAPGADADFGSSASQAEGGVGTSASQATVLEQLLSEQDDYNTLERAGRTGTTTAEVLPDLVVLGAAGGPGAGSSSGNNNQQGMMFYSEKVAAASPHPKTIFLGLPKVVRGSSTEQEEDVHAVAAPASFNLPSSKSSGLRQMPKIPEKTIVATGGGSPLPRMRIDHSTAVSDPRTESDEQQKKILLASPGEEPRFQHTRPGALKTRQRPVPADLSVYTTNHAEPGSSNVHGTTSGAEFIKKKKAGTNTLTKLG